MICPTTSEELAAALHDASSRQATVTVLGHNTKRLMAGPIAASDVTISTARLDRVLDYEPRDLTISVEAGLRYAELTRVLAERGQMVPLDPPFAEDCTVGGVVAANVNGPRRRLYGTARDMVIGMRFATLEGKIVQSGGMVVKNVAGLDMAKVMIGSFGTLAAIGVVNFKLQPIPPATRTFVREFKSIEEAIAARDEIQKSVLQPSALDLLKRDGICRLFVKAGGNRAVVDRYSRELKAFEALDGAAEQAAWDEIREFTPSFLREHPNGAVVRIPGTLSDVGPTLASLPSPALARAGNGVCYGYFEDWHDAVGRGTIEYAPDEARAGGGLWPAEVPGPRPATSASTPGAAGSARIPSPQSNFAMMKKVKDMLDPQQLLNRGRLYGRI